MSRARADARSHTTHHTPQVIAYYLLTDPHGNLNNLHAVFMHYWAPVAPSPVAAASLWRRPPPPPPASPPIFPLMDATQAKVSLVLCMLVLHCGRERDVGLYKKTAMRHKRGE